ncbi:MAG TPA: GrpB family protein [Gaiellales bacterium]
MEPVVYLITGPMAAGKTTVARLLAARFPRGVHLEGDLFRRSIVSGRDEVTPDLRPGAVEQLRLRYRLAAAAADTYAEAGFTVALEDVVAGPLLGDYRTLIRSRPCHVVVLLPTAEALAAREAGRDTKGYGAWTIEELHAGFAASTPRIGLWLDTTAMTPDETVDEILARTSVTRSPIAIADYDPGWPALFERLAEPVRAAVAGLGAHVEHVGSTAVPGLAAKPIIDIDVAVPAAADVPEAIERLRALGYVYQGDKGIRGREAFLWPPGAPVHHLYVVVAGDRPHRDHVRLREHLREHPEAVKAYAALKRDLAARYGMDRVAYTEAKTAFVVQTLRADPPEGV